MILNLYLTLSVVLVLEALVDASPVRRTVWTPQVGQPWQIVLQSPLQISSTSPSVSPNVDIFDIDLFTNPKGTIDSLHSLGKKVICYFSAGTYEPDRPDSGNFTAADEGNGVDGWPGEIWLNTGSTNVRNIMSIRIKLAASNGCDAIDPDNMDGYDNDNGLGLTTADAIDYMNFLSSEARSRNLAIGLKNAAEIISQVLNDVQFLVNEQCIQYDECDNFDAFIDSGKRVFHIEYKSEISLAESCPTGDDDVDKFSTVYKKMNLDGWVEDCSKQTATTATES